MWTMSCVTRTTQTIAPSLHSHHSKRAFYSIGSHVGASTLELRLSRIYDNLRRVSSQTDRYTRYHVAISAPAYKKLAANEIHLETQLVLRPVQELVRSTASSS